MFSFLKRTFRILRRLFRVDWIDAFIRQNSVMLVDLFYNGDLWTLREGCLQAPFRRKKLLYYSYLSNYGSWIGLGTKFDGRPIFPHLCKGVFISNNAHIGKNVVIFQQVTIGSNTLADSKNQGSPTIGDSVYIGAGAKIIGNCKVGNNCRIGANCIVTKDVPDNCVCVNRGLEIIHREEKMDNTMHPAPAR